MMVMHQLMEQIYAPVLALAGVYSLPVVDLPNTFDAYDDSLYIRCA
jgi:hypothetical protein